MCNHSLPHMHFQHILTKTCNPRPFSASSLVAPLLKGLWQDLATWSRPHSLFGSLLAFLLQQTLQLVGQQLQSPLLSVEYYQSLLAVASYLALALASALRSVTPNKIMKGVIFRSSECKASSRGSIREFRCIPYTTSIRINSNKAGPLVGS